jgi:hypothetical protein
MTFPIQHSMNKNSIHPTEHNFYFILNKILIQKKRVRQVDGGICNLIKIVVELKSVS